MKIKFLLIIVTTFIITNSLFSQTWVQLYNGEPGPVLASNYASYTGPANNYVTWANFDACKGEVQIETELIANGVKQLTGAMIQFYYNGVYHPVFNIERVVHSGSDPDAAGGFELTPCGTCSNNMFGNYNHTYLGATAYKFAESGADSYYIGNYGLLNVYNGNYSPQTKSDGLYTGGPASVTTTQNTDYSLQNTDCVSPYNLYDNGRYTALNGVEFENIDGGLGANNLWGMRFALRNLPPEMISDPNGFKVRIYQEFRVYGIA